MNQKLCDRLEAKIASGELDPQTPVCVMLSVADWANLLYALQNPVPVDQGAGLQLGRRGWMSVQEIERKVDDVVSHVTRPKPALLCMVEEIAARNPEFAVKRVPARNPNTIAPPKPWPRPGATNA